MECIIHGIRHIFVAIAKRSELNLRMNMVKPEWHFFHILYMYETYLGQNDHGSWGHFHVYLWRISVILIQIYLWLCGVPPLKFGNG